MTRRRRTGPTVYELTDHDRAVLDHICAPATDELRESAIEIHRRELRRALVAAARLLAEARSYDRSIVLRREALRRLGVPEVEGKDGE